MLNPLDKKAIQAWVNANVSAYLETGTDIVNLTELGEEYKLAFGIEDEAADDADFDNVLLEVVEAHPQIAEVGGDLVWQG